MTSNEQTWEELPLSEVVLINPKRDLHKGQMAKKVMMDNLSENYKTVNNFQESEYKGGSKFTNDDTLVARITPCLENGKTAFVDFLDEGEVGFGSTEFIVVSAKRGFTLPHFVYYLLRSPETRETLIQSMTGTSGRQRVPNEVFDSIIAPIPPIKAQESIQSILMRLDDKIELNHRMNATLEAMAQAIFKSWFVDFDLVRAKMECEEPTRMDAETAALFPDEFEEINETKVPKGWKVKSLDEIATYLNGLALQKHPPEREEYLPVIKIAQLRRGDTEGADKASPHLDTAYIVDNGDVLFSWSGSLTVVLWSGGRGALNQHLFKVTSDRYPKWFYYLWTKHHLPEFQAIASGKATTMGHIQRHHLSDAIVLVPPPDQLELMDRTLSPIISRIVANDVQSRTLATIRDTLLPKLISGEIRVPDTMLEAAEG